MNEWNIQSRAHACQSCEQSFVDKQLYHTLLFDEKGELRRLDVCDACWQSQFSEGGTDKKGVISRWQGIYEVPPAHAPTASSQISYRPSLATSQHTVKASKNGPMSEKKTRNRPPSGAGGCRSAREASCCARDHAQPCHTCAR